MRKTDSPRTVQTEEGPLDYILERKQVKNINLRVKPDLSVRVSAPPGCPAERVDAFVLSLAPRIRSAQARIVQRRQNSPPERTCRAGELLLILGEPFRLEICPGPPAVRQRDGVLLVTLPHPEDQEARQRLIRNYVRERSRSVFGEIVGATLPLLAPWGVPMPKLRVRSMKTRWGSCSPGRGAITLNTQLLAMPRSCIAYVALHELCHFVHPNHSGAFYALLSSLMPDWRERKQLLEALARQGRLPPEA